VRLAIGCFRASRSANSSATVRRTLSPSPSRPSCRLLRDEKASSGLALKPTDLSALLTEQIAHLRPFPIVFAG